MVDERAGAASADTVHALLGGITEIRDLGVLAAELDRRRRLRYETAHSRGTSNNLLHKGQSNALGDAHACRTRECKRKFRLAHHISQLCEIVLQCLANLGEMSRIILVKDLMLLTENNQLDRRRTDIHPDTEWSFQ